MPEVERTEFVDAQNMVGMRVSENNSIYSGNMVFQGLNPEIGRGVDQDILAICANENGGSGPFIPGISRPADRTVAPDHGNARRCARSHE